MQCNAATYYGATLTNTCTLYLAARQFFYCSRILLNGELWSICRVQPSDRIKLSVSKVTSEQYEQLYYDIPEIRTLGEVLVYIHTIGLKHSCGQEIFMVLVVAVELQDENCEV